MITGGTLGAIISGIIALILAYVGWRKSPEAKGKRDIKNREERREELANKDVIAIGKRLSDGYHRLRKKNRDSVR